MLPARRIQSYRDAIMAPAVGLYAGILDGLRAVGNLLIPQLCVFCGTELAAAPTFEPALCSECRRQLAPPNAPTCRRCGSPLPQYWGEIDRCPRCFDRKYRFDRTLTLGTYEGMLREAVLRMKHAEHEPLVHAMAGLLAARISAVGLAANTDLVVSTPMHWWRRLRRGVHPARILASGVARRLKLSFAPRLLRTGRSTKKQGTLTPMQRFRNVRDAFDVAAGYDLAGKQILLIDDVMTTGATVNELARVLKKRGVGCIIVAVVARGIGR